MGRREEGNLNLLGKTEERKSSAKGVCTAREGFKGREGYEGNGGDKPDNKKNQAILLLSFDPLWFCVEVHSSRASTSIARRLHSTSQKRRDPETPLFHRGCSIPYRHRPTPRTLGPARYVAREQPGEGGATARRVPSELPPLSLQIGDAKPTITTENKESLGRR